MSNFAGGKDFLGRFSEEPFDSFYAYTEALTKNTVGLAWPGSFCTDIEQLYNDTKDILVGNKEYWVKTRALSGSGVNAFYAPEDLSLFEQLKWCHEIVWAKNIEMTCNLNFTTTWNHTGGPSDVDRTLTESDMTFDTDDDISVDLFGITDRKVVQWYSKFIDVDDNSNSAEIYIGFDSEFPTLVRDGDRYGISGVIYVLFTLYRSSYILTQNPSYVLTNSEVIENEEVVECPISIYINDAEMEAVFIRPKEGNRISNISGEVRWTTSTE